MGSEHNQREVEATIEGMLREWKRAMLSFWTLGLLLNRPMYGLEIKSEVETSTQGWMEVLPSTIYQLLRRLEKRGLVTSHQEASDQGPPRTYYAITGAGREVVRRYMVEVLSPQSPAFQALGDLTATIHQSLLNNNKEPEQ